MDGPAAESPKAAANRRSENGYGRAQTNSIRRHPRPLPWRPPNQKAWNCPINRSRPPLRPRKKPASGCEIFKDDYAQAADGSGRLILARKLLDQINKAKGDIAGNYVMFHEAMDLAAEAGDVAFMRQIVESAAANFIFEPVTWITDGLEHMLGSRPCRFLRPSSFRSPLSN